MAYNGDNRRTLKQQGTNTTKFAWDAVADAYVTELDGSNVLIATYTNEPQQFGGVLIQRRGTTSHFLHADALGTTRLMTTSAQATSDTYLYDAWGNLISSTGTTANPFKWVGKYGYYTDDSTGLVYVRARLYQPIVGQYASSVTTAKVAHWPALNAYSLRNPIVENIEEEDAGIMVRNRKHPRGVSCSTLGNSAEWQFRLTAGSPCHGFIVQKVVVDCTIQTCGSSEVVELDHYIYFEAWRILKTMRVPSQFDGSDRARWAISDSYCRKGAYSQATEIRLYCNTDVGLAENDDISTSIPSWTLFNSGPTYYPGAAKEGSDCSTSSGGLTSSATAPFWDNTANRASKSGTRNFSLLFHCCHENKPCCGDGTKAPEYYYRPPESRWIASGKEFNNEERRE